MGLVPVSACAGPTPPIVNMRALPTPMRRSFLTALLPILITCAPFPSIRSCTLCSCTLCSCMFRNTSCAAPRNGGCMPLAPLSSYSVAPHLDPVVLPIGDVDVSTFIGGDPVRVLECSVELPLVPEGPDIGGRRLRL